ncbi:hypothetical protein KIPB_012056, partial [Kipferlia bialata]
HGKSVDIWALGVLLYEMLVGSAPFKYSSTQELYRKVLQAPIHFPSHVSALARDLLQKTFNRQPEGRIGANGMHEIKEHPFFHGLDWEALARREIEPPVKPLSLDTDNTMANFDPRFTKVQARDSVCLPKDILSAQDNALFASFGWTAPDAADV